MKNLPLLLLGLICTLFATNASAQTPEQARNFQIDATHSGAISSAHLTPPLRQRWAIDFGWPISYPLIADGKVFVTVKNVPITSGTTLYALDATNGATLWAFNLGGFSFWGAACYENGNVFALNGSGLLRSFDGDTGNLNWSVQLPGQSSFSAPPTVFQGVIYASGSGFGGTVYAVNANSGAVLWTTPVTSGDKSSPAVTSDGVYVSYTGPNVYKLNPATGAQLWNYPGGSGVGGKTPALYNGRLYVRDSSEFNPDIILDSETGTTLGNFIARNTPVFSDNRAFFLDGSFLFARDLTTDSFLWFFTGDGFLQSALLVVNNYVYVGSAQGNLYALDAATGQQVWTTNTGVSIPVVDEETSSQPLTGFAAAEGLLVVPTSTTLVAYEGDSVPPTTSASFSGTAGTNGWYRSAVQVSLSATDDFSGVQNSFYRINGGATQTYAGTFLLSILGQHTVEYWSVDNVNNTEVTHSQLVKIDNAAPVVTASANPATSPKRPQPVNVTISGSVTDGVSGVSSADFNVIDEYGVAQPSGSVTVQANGTYSFTLSLPATKNGGDKDGHLYTIVVSGLDQAGNSASATTTLRIN